MLRVGLTGGIGSGKSTIANYFAELGVPIIDSDLLARELTEPSTKAYNAILEKFGDSILGTDKQINRKKLRELIFSDQKIKQWLEDLLHPLIKNEIAKRLAKLSYPYSVIVIPLLVEIQSFDLIDRVLLVDSSVKKQKERASFRDSASLVDINKIMDSQAKRKERLAVANDIIVNEGDLEELKIKVLNQHVYYLALCSK